MCVCVCVYMCVCVGLLHVFGASKTNLHLIKAYASIVHTYVHMCIRRS